MISALFPSTALANDSTLGGTGMTVYPIFDTEVEMEKEVIDIVVKGGCSYVTCKFWFHNTGESTDLLVGFPTQYPGGYESQEELDETMEDEWYNEDHVTQLNWFRTWVDGERVRVTVKTGLEPEGNNADELYFPQWYTWKMHFNAGERIKVVNKYWFVNSYGGENSEWFSYILRSGATWKGPIGKITIRVRLEDCSISDVWFHEMQPTYIEEDGLIVWEAENIKPEQDVNVLYADDPFEQNGDNPFASYDSQDEYWTYQNISQRMLRNFYAGHYNGVTWWGNRMFDKFGDTQSSQLYYCMGVSYYKLGYTEKALNMFGRIQDNLYDAMSAYYKALICEEAGDDTGYQSYLDSMTQYLSGVAEDETSWAAYWIKSRLSDLQG
jgi:hypothetical protein